MQRIEGLPRGDERSANYSARIAFGRQSQISREIPDKSLRLRFFIKGYARLFMNGILEPMAMLMDDVDGGAFYG